MDKMNEVDERVTEEIEALTAIMLDEIVIIYDESGKPKTVEATLLPATAADEEQQFVTVTLAVDLTPGYPDECPVIRLKNPRGLSDDLLNTIYAETHSKCQDYVGQSVIYELIELVKEHLTSSNTPNCHCTICLYGFHEEDEFTKTPCFHYFHAHCLACYVRSCLETRKAEKEKLPLWQQIEVKSKDVDDFSVPCPVCREPVICQLEKLSQAAAPHDVSTALHFQVTEELRALQRKMSALYVKQQSKGGIIDIEAEENKCLLVTQTVAESTASTSPPVSTTANNTQGYRPQAPGSRSWRTDRRPQTQSQPTTQRPMESSSSSSSNNGRNKSSKHRESNGRRGGGRRSHHDSTSCESTR